jgi:uncharacterized protein YdiU (UPF0061 family)
MGSFWYFGVMNTDNMSIEGLTIDYDYQNICNHTDHNGRYSFGNQPQIGHWNLEALMNALSPIINTEKMQKVLTHYSKLYTQRYIYLMGKKLGLDEATQEKDLELIKHLLGVLQSLSLDYTLFFRTLSYYDGKREELLKLGLYHQPMVDWLDSYDKRLKDNNSSQQERQKTMLKVNPKYILKNYMLQEAIDATQNSDFSVLNALFEIVQDPYSEHKEFERWAKATPNEFKNQKLSCSS